MSSKKLYRDRIKVSTKLRALFDDIYIQFAKPYFDGLNVPKSLPECVIRFEKDLSKIPLEDIEFIISEFKRFRLIYIQDSDVNDFENSSLREFMTNLSMVDKEFFYQNREITISIMDSFVKK